MPDSNKKYKLLGADGEIYLSDTPGMFGGNGNLKIYGRLDCGTALNSIRKYPLSIDRSSSVVNMVTTSFPTPPPSEPEF